jgi:hypothetical protein
MAAGRDAEQRMVQQGCRAANRGHAGSNRKPSGRRDGNNRHLVFAYAYERPPGGSGAFLPEKYEEPQK